MRNASAILLDFIAKKTGSSLDRFLFLNIMQLAHATEASRGIFDPLCLLALVTFQLIRQALLVLVPIGHQRHDRLFDPVFS